MSQNKDLFSFHILNEKGKEEAGKIADAFVKFYHELSPLLGEASRYRSIVETKLEEASFFAKKAIANKSENFDSVSHQL